MYKPQVEAPSAPAKPPPQGKTVPMTKDSVMDDSLKPDQASSIATSVAAAPWRESSRQIKLPSRLEDNDPEAQKVRMIEKCQAILKLLLQKDGLGGRFFLEPVDPVAHGIPTYHQIITNPMNLGTIQAKMNSSEIDSHDEFARLGQLVFKNALKFNVDPNHMVHQAAQNLLTFLIRNFARLT